MSQTLKNLVLQVGQDIEGGDGSGTSLNETTADPDPWGESSTKVFTSLYCPVGFAGPHGLRCHSGNPVRIWEFLDLSDTSVLRDAG